MEQFLLLVQSLYSFQEDRIWPRAHCAKTLFHSTAFPLVGRGRWETLASAVQNDGLAGERGAGKKPGPQFPGSLPSQAQVFPNHLCSGPSWEVSQQFVTFLHFPSLPLVTSNFRTELTDVPGLLNLRWMNQAGSEFVYNFCPTMRERKRKKGGEPDCWQCNLGAKSVFNSSSPLCRKQATHLGNQVLSRIMSLDIFPGSWWHMM